MEEGVMEEGVIEEGLVEGGDCQQATASSGLTAHLTTQTVVKGWGMAEVLTERRAEGKAHESDSMHGPCAVGAGSQSARRAAISKPPPQAISNAASSDAVTEPCMKAGGHATIPVPRMTFAVVAVRCPGESSDMPRLVRFC
jgi:hypothetical protein